MLELLNCSKSTPKFYEFSTKTLVFAELFCACKNYNVKHNFLILSLLLTL